MFSKKSNFNESRLNGTRFDIRKQQQQNFADNSANAVFRRTPQFVNGNGPVQQTSPQTTGWGTLTNYVGTGDPDFSTLDSRKEMHNFNQDLMRNTNGRGLSYNQQNQLRQYAKAQSEWNRLNSKGPENLWSRMFGVRRHKVNKAEQTMKAQQGNVQNIVDGMRGRKYDINGQEYLEGTDGYKNAAYTSKQESANALNARNQALKDSWAKYQKDNKIGEAEVDQTLANELNFNDVKGLQAFL